MNRAVTVSLLAAFSGSALAEIVKIPEEGGLSGFVSGGAKYSELSSNLVAGNKNDDLSSDVINDLGSPSSTDNTSALFAFDLRYTLADSGTQFFLGNLIQDALRYDFSQQIGVRQQVGDKGIVSVGYLFSGFPAEVYADPFLTGSARAKTDLDSSGVRLGWDNIWGSRFNASLSFRNQDLDSEQSGTSQGLTPEEVRSLDRNGDIISAEVSYHWVLGGGHLLTPALTYSQYDLDGNAVSRDRTMVQLTHTYNHGRYTLVSNAAVGQVSYDEGNPVFGGRKADSDEYGVASTLFMHRLMDIDQLSGFVNAAYGHSDSDISFYDAKQFSIGTGALYRF